MIQKERIRNKLYKKMCKDFDISIDIFDRIYSNIEISLFVVFAVSIVNIENKVRREYTTIFRNIIIPEEFFFNQKPMDAEISEIVNEHFEELL